MPLPLAATLALGLGPSLLQGIGGLIAGKATADSSMKIAQYTADRNEAYMNQMLAYNTPANQMQRFKDAGLNPALMYGQGNPGNQSSPVQMPQAQAREYGQALAAIPLLNQSRMVTAQVQAQNASTIQKTQLTEVNKMQARLIAANPLLNDEGFKAMIDSMKSAAQLKATEAEIRSNDFVRSFIDTQFYQEKGYEKLTKEFELLNQRFNLNTADQNIKAQVLKSKEFQNAILEVQKKFLTDAEITPGQWVQFIQMLILKAF